MHPPLVASSICLRTSVHESIKRLCSSSMQQQQPGTVTHLRINSLLISRRLTRPRVASRYSVRASSYFKQLTHVTSQLHVPVIDNNYVCHECINVTGSGRGDSKISGALRVPVAEPPFLNFQIRHWLFQATCAEHTGYLMGGQPLVDDKCSIVTTYTHHVNTLIHLPQMEECRCT